MSTFKNIQGKNIRSYANNAPNATAGEMWYNRTEQKLKGVVSTGAWSSASDALYPSYNTTGFGAQTSSVFVGGSYPGYVNLTQEYNGSGFSTGGNYPESRGGIGTAGVLTAGLAWGGNSSPEFESQLTNEYNGTAWTNVNNYPITVSAPAGAGTQTAGLGAGGWDYSGPFSAKNTTNEYDGTNWTGGGNLNTGRSSFWGGGTQTAAIMAGGDKFTPGTASDYSAETEEYDGTSWTSVNSLPGTTNGQGGRTTNAVQTDFRVFSSSQGTAFTSPYVKNYEYDGTNWAAGSNFTTARYGVAGSGTGPAAIITGGRTPSYVTTTEEFNKSTNIITGAAWASGGNLNTARNGGNGTATNSAADTGLTFGGNYPSGTDNSEEYNGTTWAEGNNLPQAISLMGGAGTQTAGLSFTGRLNPGSRIDDTYEYDGTSWGSGGNYGADQAYTSGAGTQTAALGVAGETPPGTDLTTSYEYDGSSWTAGNACNVPGYSGLVFGTSAGAILACLSGPPTGLESESYDGTNWTAGPTTVITQTQGGASGTYPIGLIFGGSASAPSTSTQGWDGTAWSTRPSLSTGRRASGSGVTAQGLAQGGETPGSPTSAATEEFTPETTSINVETLTQS